MKKFFLVLTLVLSIFTLAACGELEEVEIALITDYGDIDDESFNQGTWEGIVEFAEERGIAHEYYRPADVSDSDYINSIDTAVEDGAQIVVTPGFLFERAIYESQQNHPDVNFILLDAEPLSDDDEYHVADNTLSIFYEEHESGFLAGYASVLDGHTDLGYMGGIAVPAVVRFGIGFIAGAYYAAEEENISITFPDDRYAYLGTFNAGADVETQAAGWYDDGLELIFAAAGGAGGSVMSAAEEADAWMIGVDVDQSAESDRVLTSAMKALGASVQQALAAHYDDDDFPGGQTWDLGAAEDGVALPMDTSRFTEFTQDDYDAIYDTISSGDFMVPANHSELETFFSEHGLGDLVFAEDTVQP